MIGANPLGEYVNLQQQPPVAGTGYSNGPAPYGEIPHQPFTQTPPNPWQNAQGNQGHQTGTQGGGGGWVKTSNKPPKAQSAVDKYLAHDTDYLRTLRDLSRGLADYQARQKIERTRAGADFGYAKRNMADQSTHDLSNMADDFAARGIVRSGVYGQKVGDYNTQYGKQQAELGRNYNNQLTDFTSGYKDYVRQQQLQKETARDAAIRRRAAQLGL